MERKINILVVEDEKPLLNAIRTKLELHGFDVVTARTFEQAINHINDIENIDVIWLDHYLLGKEDGLDLVTRLKGDNRLKKIPIFVVSNTASPDKIQSYIRFGISQYYTKSDYRLDQIINDIKVYLNEETKE